MAFYQESVPLLSSAGRLLNSKILNATKETILVLSAPRTQTNQFLCSMYGGEKIFYQSGVGDMEDVLLEGKLQQPIRPSLIMMNYMRID